jgi:uncharacterized protein DUF4112
MTHFLDAVRQRRQTPRPKTLPERLALPERVASAQRLARATQHLDRRALWESARAWVVALSKPRRGIDAALPQWVHVLVGLSDDGIRIPGTRVRLGLDAVLGTLLPGAGDALGGVTAAMLMYVAWKRGAPTALLYRMLGNATLDIGLGSIPIVGDIFDLGFHANRRNLNLLEDFLTQRTKQKRASRLAAVFAFAGLGIVMILVMVGLVGLAIYAWHSLQQH